MQEYLLEGNKNTYISRLIFKARGRNLDIKTHKKWKYDDDLCVGCGINVESEEELITCESLSANNEKASENYSYNCFFGVIKMVTVAKMIDKRIKNRQKNIRRSWLKVKNSQKLQEKTSASYGTRCLRIAS